MHTDLREELLAMADLDRTVRARLAADGSLFSDEAETISLDHLAATCNVELSAKACGFSPQTVYRRRRLDPTFMRRWDEALKQGYAALEALLVRRAIEAFEGFAPDPSAATRIPEMTVRTRWARKS